MSRGLRTPPSPALDQMLAEDQARGVDVLNDEPRPPGPPEVSAPLIRPGLPPVDWRAEEEDRLRREAAEKEAEAETPNLARAKELQAEARQITRGAP